MRSHVLHCTGSHFYSASAIPQLPQGKGSLCPCAVHHSEGLARPPASWQESLGRFMTLSFHTLSSCPDHQHWTDSESSPQWAHTVPWLVCCQNTGRARWFSKPSFGKKLLKVRFSVISMHTQLQPQCEQQEWRQRRSLCSCTVWWGTDVPTWRKGAEEFETLPEQIYPLTDRKI